MKETILLKKNVTQTIWNQTKISLSERVPLSVYEGTVTGHCCCLNETLPCLLIFQGTIDEYITIMNNIAQG